MIKMIITILLLSTLTFNYTRIDARYNFDFFFEENTENQIVVNDNYPQNGEDLCFLQFHCIQNYVVNGKTLLSQYSINSDSSQRNTDTLYVSCVLNKTSFRNIIGNFSLYANFDNDQDLCTFKSSYYRPTITATNLDFISCQNFTSIMLSHIEHCVNSTRPTPANNANIVLLFISVIIVMWCFC